MPQNSQFCWFWAKWDLPITSQETIFMRIFYGLTLEIPVYESQNRDSVRLAETRHFSRWEIFFLVPKHIKMAQNTQIHPGKVFWRLK